MAEPATLTTLDREDAKQLFARGEPGDAWKVLESLLETYSGQPARQLRLEPAWQLLEQALEAASLAQESKFAAARQLFSRGRPLPGIEDPGQATMMRPDLVPHAARELAELDRTELLRLVPHNEADGEAAWQILQAVSELVDRAADDGYCVVFVQAV